MNLAIVEKIAKAVLYEGYLLYPYRPSAIKNRQRWNFGVLYPRSYSQAQAGSDRSMIETECLVEGNDRPVLEVRVRFLQLVERLVGQLISPVSQLLPGELPDFQLVERFEVNGKVFHPWQEAVEREISLPGRSLASLSLEPLVEPFALSSGKHVEPLRDSTGQTVGIIIRDQQPIRGVILLSARQVGDKLSRISVRIENETPFELSGGLNREAALLRSLVSTHTILGIEDGAFVSALDPPDSSRELAADCQNIGTWPVLVGEEGQRDTMLSSPIILYDYPQIAPESAGELFDGTEIDEILSLRIMTLTEEEKSEMRQSDERARELLERTETLPMDQLMKLHGVLRGMRPLNEEDTQ
jgi:hydrogenase maturation protease